MSGWISNRDIYNLLQTFVAKVNHMSMTDQQHADAVIAHLQTIESAISSAVDGIEAQIADLKAQVAAGATPLDFGPLDAEVDKLQGVSDRVVGDAPPLNPPAAAAKKP